MATVHSLSESDVAALREGLSADKPPTVWFTSAAVGVPVGGSAKVMSVGQVAEGDFIEVRPTGSKDTMFCSANELTGTRPPRKRVPRSPGTARPVGASSVPAAATASPSAATPSAAAPSAPAAVLTSGDESESDEAPAARRSAQRRPPSAEVTVTLFGSTEGQWTVEVMVGKKRAVRLMPVQPAEVAKLSRSLPAPVAEAIETSLAVARDRQAERIEQLRAELDAAQRVLRDLST